MCIFKRYHSLKVGTMAPPTELSGPLHIFCPHQTVNSYILNHFLFTFSEELHYIYLLQLFYKKQDMYIACKHAYTHHISIYLINKDKNFCLNSPVNDNHFLMYLINANLAIVLFIFYLLLFIILGKITFNVASSHSCIHIEFYQKTRY
jgi:hypothetical protein